MQVKDIMYSTVYRLVFVALFRSFLSCSIWYVFGTLVRLILSCFGRFGLVVYGSTTVVHTTGYYQLSTG